MTFTAKKAANFRQIGLFEDNFRVSFMRLVQFQKQKYGRYNDSLCIILYTTLAVLIYALTSSF